MNTYYAGNDLAIRATLKINAIVQPLSGSTVRGQLLKQDGTASTLPVTTCVLIDAANGVAEARWTKAQTDSLPPGLYLMDYTQTAVDGGVTTYERHAVRIGSKTP